MKWGFDDLEWKDYKSPMENLKQSSMPLGPQSKFSFSSHDQPAMLDFAATFRSV